MAKWRQFSSRRGRSPTDCRPPAGRKVLRSFLTEADRASGITHDGQALWLGSTYNRELIRTDDKTGKAISKHFTPVGCDL